MAKDDNDFVVLSGSANRMLAEKICDYLKVKPADADVLKYQFA